MRMPKTKNGEVSLKLNAFDHLKHFLIPIIHINLEEHRLGLINREISSGSKNFFWQCVFLFFAFAFCGICVFAINTGEAEANTQKG